jgi:hypothetical protein
MAINLPTRELAYPQHQNRVQNISSIINAFSCTREIPEVKQSHELMKSMEVNWYIKLSEVGS